MLQRQKLWVPVLKHNPSFTEYFNRFITGNPITSMNVAALNLRPESMFVALQPDKRNHGKQVAAMLAVNIKVLRPACDVLPDIIPSRRGTEDHGNGSAAEAVMNYGFATALVDSMNSFHVMERLLPVYVPHVSVNIQSQLCEPAPCSLAEGTDLVVISTIEKFGKRLVYCSTDFYLDEPTVPAERAAREAGIENLADLQGALRCYRRLLHGTHVKSVLLDDKSKKKG